jgi:hypothetical protein
MLGVLYEVCLCPVLNTPGLGWWSMTDLLPYDTQLNKLECPNVPASLRERWLWGLDLAEEVGAKHMLNEAHLTGLVLCRVAALQRPDIQGSPCDLIGDAAVVRTPYQNMSMTQLHDAVEHVQMHMHALLLDTAAAPYFTEHLTCLFTRLGAILLPIPSHTDSVFDDPDSLELTTAGVSTRVMTSNTIRWFLNIFVILYRHVELRRLVEPPEIVGARMELEEVHVEAATDDFYKFSQYFDLPPAAVLQYSCDFAQMMNSVSQVTYYYFPNYERRNQLPFDQVGTGAPAIYALAPVLSMVPSVTILYEEDDFGAAPGAIGHPNHAKAGWRIILGAGFIYLLTPSGRVFSHPNILELVRAIPIP